MDLNDSGISAGKAIIAHVLFMINAARLLPAAVLWVTSTRRDLIIADVTRWQELCLPGRTKGWATWVELMGRYPEFRNVVYFRLGWPSQLVAWLCRPEPTLHICTRHIGPGLFIQHGFATIITAKSIGRECWVNQQVTIGHKGQHAPAIGDRVRVAAGAKVLGGITVGNDVTIGANAVVVKDVPDGCTVVGVPARIVKRYGRRVDETTSG
jgi:serine O-acetyltransferase